MLSVGVAIISLYANVFMCAYTVSFCVKNYKHLLCICFLVCLRAPGLTGLVRSES